jgi:inorganic pyrophosphatase
VAVAEESYTHSNVKELEQLNRTFLEEVEAFFVNYQKEHGKKFKVLGIGDSKEAFRLLRRTIDKAA